MPIVRVMEHGQVTIPKKFREILDISKGDLAEVELDGKRIVITPKKLVAINKLKAVMKKVHEQNKEFSEEEVLQDVLETISEIREEKYARQR